MNNSGKWALVIGGSALALIVVISAIAGTRANYSRADTATATKTARTDFADRRGRAYDEAEKIRGKIERAGLTASEAQDKMMTASDLNDFKKGNDAYRKGNYQKAYDSYLKVLNVAPWHFGALNNIVLASLQLGKTQTALDYALVALELYPDSQELLLNAEVAAVSDGYSTTDLLQSYQRMVGSAAGNDKVYDAITYNQNYGAVVFNKFADSSLSQGEKERKYSDALLVLKSLKSKHPEDKDIPALMKYLQGIGQLNNVVEKPAKK